MKKIIFIITSLIICYTANGQYVNVDKLPLKIRDSILIKVANEAVNRFSVGYSRADSTPIIEDLGIIKKELYEIDETYLGIHFFTVSFKGTEEEHKYFKKNYITKVFIRSDNCKPVTIRYIDDWDHVISRLDNDETLKYLKHKRHFISIEEREKMKKPEKIIINNTPSEYWRKFDERAKHRRDSVMKEIQKSIELKRKAMEEQQKADSIKSQEQKIKPY